MGSKKTVRVECPACKREIGLRWNGQLSPHQDRIGVKCRGRLSVPVSKVEIREVKPR